MSRRPSLAIALSAAIVGLSAFTAAPANAAIPSGEHLVTLGCSSQNGRLVDVNPDTSEGTVIGPSFSDSRYNCALQAAFDPVSGFIYYPQLPTAFNEYALYKTDLTGDQSNIGDIHTADSTKIDLTSLAIDSNGNAYGYAMDEKFYSVNLETAEVTYIGTATSGGYSYQSLAFDRTDNTLYAMRDGSGFIYTVDVETGAATSTGISITNYVMGITFNDDGLMYILTDDNLSELATYNFDTNTKTILNGGTLLNVGGVNYYTQSAVYYGEVTGGAANSGGGAPSGSNGLAATGVNTVGFVGLGAVLIAAGAIARRRKVAR